MTGKIYTTVIAIAVIGLLLAVAACWLMGRHWLESRRFTAEREEIYRIVEVWQRQPPPGVDGHVWQEVCKLGGIAVGNVCFTPRHVSLEEIEALRADVAAKDAAPIDADTLQWLWDRLAATGPHGQRYTRRMQPMWDEAMDAVRPEAAQP